MHPTPPASGARTIIHTLTLAVSTSRPKRPRRRGVHRALHTWAEQQARRTPGVCGLRLYVDRQNTRAQQVYARLGLKPTEYRLYETDWSRCE